MLIRQCLSLKSEEGYDGLGKSFSLHVDECVTHPLQSQMRHGASPFTSSSMQMCACACIPHEVPVDNLGLFFFFVFSPYLCTVSSRRAVYTL